MSTELTAKELRTHAGSLEKAIETLSNAEGASSHVRLGSESYGLLCQFLPPIMQGRHDTMDDLFKKAKENLSGHARNLRNAADDLSGTDHNNGKHTEDAGKDLHDMPDMPDGTPPSDSGSKPHTPHTGRR